MASGGIVGVGAACRGRWYGRVEGTWVGLEFHSGGEGRPTASCVCGCPCVCVSSYEEEKIYSTEVILVFPVLAGVV